MSSLYYYWKQYMEQRTKVAAITAVSFSLIITISIIRQLQDSILFTSLLLTMGIITILLITRVILSTIAMPLKVPLTRKGEKNLFAVLQMKINGTTNRQLHTADGLVAWEWRTKAGVEKEIQLYNHKKRENVRVMYTENKVIVKNETENYTLDLERIAIPSQFTIKADDETYVIRREKDRLVFLNEHKIVGTFEWTLTLKSLQDLYGTRQRIITFHEEVSLVGLVASIIAIDEWLDYYTML